MAAGQRVGWITWSDSSIVEGPNLVRIGMPRNPRDYAARLYAALHDLDAAMVDRIVVAAPRICPIGWPSAIVCGAWGAGLSSIFWPNLAPSRSRPLSQATTLGYHGTMQTPASTPSPGQDETSAEEQDEVVGPSTLPAANRTSLPTAQVYLRPRKSRPFYGRHPWVLDSAIARVEGTPADGDVVDLISDKGKFIARGIFNSQSRIRVRLYNFRPEPLDEAFWRERLLAAVDLRKRMGYDDREGGARIAFSEADQLSGLIIDRYANYLALQITASAMAMRLEMWDRAIGRDPRRAALPFAPRRESASEGLELTDGIVWGRHRPVLCSLRSMVSALESNSRRDKRPGFISISAKTGSRPPAIFAIVACWIFVVIAVDSASRPRGSATCREVTAVDSSPASHRVAHGQMPS